jgi:hypothetical protein
MHISILEKHCANMISVITQTSRWLGEEFGFSAPLEEVT